MRGLIGTADGMGVRRLAAEYQPTAKNEVEAGLYNRLGFYAGEGLLFGRDLNAGETDLITYVIKADR